MIQKLCSTCLHMPTSTRDAPCKDCLRFNETNLIDSWTPRPGAVIEITKPSDAANPLNAQVGGNHYKNRVIQPVEYSHANKLNGLEASIVKRITRWRDKPAETRFQDLEKIKHEVDLLIELEKKYG